MSANADKFETQSKTQFFFYFRAKDGEKMDDDTGLFEQAHKLFFLYLRTFSLTFCRLPIFDVLQRIDALTAAGLSAGLALSRECPPLSWPVGDGCLQQQATSKYVRTKLDLPGSQTISNLFLFTDKKAKMSSTGGTSIGSLGNGGGGGSSNSNDSLDFASKQLLNEALIDEGLRMAKEMGHALSDENIDLRLFNKYTEALRNSNCFASLLPGAIGAEQSSTGNGNANNGNNGNGTSSGGSGNIVGSSVVTGTNSSSSSHTRALKEGGHRPRGRPPKNAAAVSAERCAPDLQSTFYEQIFSQAQLQQQMIANYQTQALQAALAFDFAGLAGAGPNPFAGGNGGDGNNNNNGSSSNNNSDKMDAVASAHLTDFTMHLSEGKHFGDGGGGGGGAGSGNGGGDGSKDCDAAAAAAAVELLNGCDKDEVAQSLNALISIANAASASEVIKHELSLPSVDFKIA